MNYEKRLAALEKYFCTKIIEEYKRALASTSLEDDVPNLDDLDEDKLVGKRAQAALDDINLLTHEERMKYDPEYAHREEIRKLNEQEANQEILGKATGQKVPRSSKPVSNRKSPSSKKTGNNKELVKQGSQREENPITPYRLTDEEILKWDPDNFDRIRQIDEENDRKWEVEHGEKPMVE